MWRFLDNNKNNNNYPYKSSFPPPSRYQTVVPNERQQNQKQSNSTSSIDPTLQHQNHSQNVQQQENHNAKIFFPTPPLRVPHVIQRNHNAQTCYHQKQRQQWSKAHPNNTHNDVTFRSNVFQYPPSLSPLLPPTSLPDPLLFVSPAPAPSQSPATMSTISLPASETTTDSSPFTRDSPTSGRSHQTTAAYKNNIVSSQTLFQTSAINHRTTENASAFKSINNNNNNKERKIQKQKQHQQQQSQQNNHSETTISTTLDEVAQSMEEALDESPMNSSRRRQLIEAIREMKNDIFDSPPQQFVVPPNSTGDIIIPTGATDQTVIENNEQIGCCSSSNDNSQTNEKIHLVSEITSGANKETTPSPDSASTLNPKQPLVLANVVCTISPIARDQIHQQLETGQSPATKNQTEEKEGEAEELHQLAPPNKSYNHTNSSTAFVALASGNNIPSVKMADQPLASFDRLLKRKPVDERLPLKQTMVSSSSNNINKILNTPLKKKRKSSTYARGRECPFCPLYFAFSHYELQQHLNKVHKELGLKISDLYTHKGERKVVAKQIIEMETRRLNGLSRATFSGNKNKELISQCSGQQQGTLLAAKNYLETANKTLADVFLSASTQLTAIARNNGEEKEAVPATELPLETHHHITAQNHNIYEDSEAAHQLDYVFTTADSVEVISGVFALRNDAYSTPDNHHQEVEQTSEHASNTTTEGTSFRTSLNITKNSTSKKAIKIEVIQIDDDEDDLTIVDYYNLCMPCDLIYSTAEEYWDHQKEVHPPKIVRKEASSR